MITALQLSMEPRQSETLPASDKRLLTLLLFAFCAVVYVGSAFSPALQDDADSTHAEAAREMFVTGDYVTLHVNGVRYLEKAPLVYWLVALSYRLFGVNEFATRLPNVLTMFLLAALVMRWGSRAFGDIAGLYAGLFTATAAGFYLFTRILIPDALLTLLIAASFYFFLSALSEAGAWRWYAAYACLALAVLTKGLVPLVFVGTTAVVYLAATGEWRRWREFRLGSGLLVFLLIAAPWHILAGVRNPHFFWFYFVNEHFLRFIGKRYPVDYNKVPAFWYWTLHLVWLFPWALYAPIAALHLGRSRQRADRSFGSRTRLLCWIWAGVVLVFFAFSTSQEYYTMPAYVPILLLIAGAIAQEEAEDRRKWLVTISALLALVTLIASGVLIWGLWSSRHLPFVSDIGTVLEHNLSEDTLSMSHALDLTGQSFAALRLPAILAAVALAIGPLTALLLRVRGKHLAATITTAATMVMFLVAAHIALVRFDPYLSSKTLAEKIAQQATTSDKVMIYGDQAFGSSLLFYLRRPIYLVNGRTTSMWFGSTYPDAPKIYLDDSDLVRTWTTGTRVFLFVPSHQKKTVEALLPNEVVVGESSGKMIYSNR